MRIFLCIIIFFIVSTGFSQTKKPKTKPTQKTVNNPQEATTKDGKLVLLKDDGTWIYANKSTDSKSDKKNSEINSVFIPKIGEEIIYRGMGVTLNEIRLDESDKNYPKLNMTFRIKNISYNGSLGFSSYTRIKEDINGFDYQRDSYDELGNRGKYLLKNAEMFGNITLYLSDYSGSEFKRITPKRIVVKIRIIDNEKNFSINAENSLVLEIDEKLLNPVIKKQFEQYNVEEIRKNQEKVAKQNLEPLPLLNQANQLYKSGRDDEAMAILRKVLNIEPQSSEAYLLSGKIHLRRSDLEQATSYLKTSLFWDNSQTEAYILLCRIFVEKKDCLTAKNYAEAANKIDGENQEVIGLLRLVERCGK
jgi:hypothetical protein